MSKYLGLLLAGALLLGGVARAADWRHLFPWPEHEILLLGTFHFKDAGLDSYKPEFDVDILSQKRQEELDSLLGCLAEYQPTKIALEVKAARQAELDADYRGFLAGEFELTSDEIHQIGFRLAKRLGLERVYAIDAQARWYEPYVDPDEYAVEHGQGHLLESELVGKYDELYRMDDRDKAERPLDETLAHLNDLARVRLGHGRYLIENFSAGNANDYPGVDSKTAWYNRNLRIFANIQRLVDLPEERIFVLIGAGHLPILRHAIESSPEYEFVWTYPYLSCVADERRASRAPAAPGQRPRHPEIESIEPGRFDQGTGEILAAAEMIERGIVNRNDLGSSLLATITVRGAPGTYPMQHRLHVHARKGNEIVEDRRFRLGVLGPDGAFLLPVLVHGPICEPVRIEARLETPGDGVVDHETLHVHYECGE